MKKFFLKHQVAIIFLIFFAIVYFEHQFLYLYHDDFGYASLSYQYVVEGAIGHSNNLKQIFEFLVGHYNVWGGRILFFFLECLLLNTSLPLFRFVQSIFIVLIFYMIYKIIYFYIKKDKVKIALLSCSMYGLIQIGTFKSGIFWITASVLYVFPVFFLLLFYYLYISYDLHKIKNKILKVMYILLMSILIFIATFSQEQTAVVALGFTMLALLYVFIKQHKIKKENVAYFISSLIGFLILMLAPGNSSRMTTSDFYSLGLFSKIRSSFSGVLANIYGQNDKIIIVLLFIVAIFCSIRLLKEKPNKLFNLFLKVILISNVFVIAITLWGENGYYINLCEITNLSFFSIIPCLITAFQTVLWTIPILVVLFKENKIMLMNLFFLAIISQIIMLYNSYYPLRSMLIFDFIFFIILIYIIYLECDRNKFDKSLIVISILLISILNTSYITYGYYQNSKINENNEAVLVNASKQIKAGENIKSVNIQKLKNDLFGGEMPYQTNYQYIENWMKKYYELPDDIVFQYY